MEKTPIPAPLRSTTPNTYRSVPTRPADADLRPGEYMTPAEIEKLIKAARVGPLSTPTCCDTPQCRPRYAAYSGLANERFMLRQGIRIVRKHEPGGAGGRTCRPRPPI